MFGIALAGFAGAEFEFAQAGAQVAGPLARGMIDGIVTDTGVVPLAGATVTLAGTKISVTTGENGRFRIKSVPAGEYIAIVRRVGYNSISVRLTVDSNEVVRPSFMLQRLAFELDTVRVHAGYQLGPLSEFEERRARKIGHFITADDIEKRNPVYISDALRSIMSVTIDDRIPGKRVALSGRASANCPFQVFIDGGLFSETGDLSAAPSPREIAGIEVYSGPATIPLEYRRQSTMCGIILIWTKAAG